MPLSVLNPVRHRKCCTSHRSCRASGQREGQGVNSQHPSVLERGLAKLGSLLLEFLDGPLVNTSALVDQVTGGGRLARVDVTDDDNVDVSLFLAHGDQ